jgi:hypothetical protein
MSEEKPNDEQSGDKDTPPPEFVRFVGLLKKILAASKEELDERKAEYERKKREKKREECRTCFSCIPYQRKLSFRHCLFLGISITFETRREAPLL